MIRKYKLDSAWVGLNDEHKENHFVWFKGNCNGGYKTWCPNHTHNKNYRENCVELTTPHHCLNNDKCHSNKPFICEINDSKKNVSYFGH